MRRGGRAPLRDGGTSVSPAFTVCCAAQGSGVSGPRRVLLQRLYVHLRGGRLSSQPTPEETGPQRGEAAYRGTRVESGRVGLPRALNAELIIIIYSWSRVPQASGPPVHGKRLRHIASLTHGAPYRSINFPPQEGRSRFPVGARNLLVSYRWKTHTGGTGPSAI